MRIPKSEFTDADLALCRAHGDAIYGRREAVALLRWADACAPVAKIDLTVRAFEVGVHMPSDLPLPPSYWDDLEHWLKTLAPAKPAVQQSEPAAGVWNREDPPAPGVYVACHDLQDQRPQHYAHWSGMDWTITYAKPDSAMEGRRRGMISNARDYLWLRLIEADAPAARLASTSSASDGAWLVGAKQSITELRHLVCVQDPAVQTGRVFCCRSYADAASELVKALRQELDWRLCDADGFIPHTPTADSVCPVPDGVMCQLRFECGDETGVMPIPRQFSWRNDQEDGNIIAWRPIAKAAG